MADNPGDAIAKDFDQLKKITAECLKNAQDLVKSAKLLIDENVDHICFHLAALALEEIGKITLLRTKFGARVAGRSEDFSTPVIDDHIKKLFWAFWGPMFAQGDISREQVDQWKGMAQSIHKRRLHSLYVDPGDGVSAEAKVTHEEAVRLVNLAEARVGLQAEEGEQELDEKTTQLLSWFIDASDDPEQRAYMFAKESMDKLAELKSPRKWIEGLHEEAMTLQAEAQKSMEEELSRPVPFGAEANEKRWKIKIRLYSASHSIRKKTLTKWNDMSSHIFLYPTNRHDELVCEFNLVKRLSVKDMWPGLWDVSRLFVLSLNIATQGFFWWYRRVR